MSTHRRRRRQLGDRGGVTVETALALPAFLLVLLAGLGAVTAAAEKIRCVDAAREAARLTARGQQDEGHAAAKRIAPENAEVTITMTGEHIEVQVKATAVGGLLPGLELEAEAFAVREPDG